jgi:uncharacterized protein DUF4423
MKRVDGFTAGEQTAAKNNISTSDLIHFSGNWVWRAVEALVQAKDFNPDPVWIADRLNISAEAAKDALEGLVRIGLIVKDGESFKAATNFYNYDSNQIDRSDMFYIHTKIRDQVSLRINTKDCFSNMIFLSNKELISKFYSQFSNIIEKLNEEALKAECKEVYAFEMSFAKLTRD